VQRVGTLVNPRAAAILTPTDNDSIKLLYGRAFRAPNLYEMFYASPGANVPNPSLRPEIVDTFEAVWERRWTGGWRTTLDGFLSNMSDAMEGATLDDGSLVTRNAGTARALGLEAEIEKKWSSGARIRAHAAATCARGGDGSLAHSPAWITGMSFAIPIINKNTFLAIEPQIVGPQKNDLNQYTNPTFITNVVLTSRDFLTKGLELQLGAYNLLGEYARMPRSDAATHFQPTLDAPTSQFMASLTYKF
jgi:iron complex outermembrane receptor protein